MQFDAVVLGRSYEQVVRQIRDAIRQGRLAPGQRLPTERELGESFGVSRGVVREAIKVLHAMGLVEARQGAAPTSALTPSPPSSAPSSSPSNPRSTRWPDSSSFAAP